MSAQLAVDLGLGPTPATVEFCFDESDEMSLLEVSFRGDDVDPKSLLDLIEKRWSTFLSLGVMDSVSESGATGWFEALALDDGGCHALVSWSETGTGEIPGLSISIVPGNPPWVSTSQDPKHELLYEFDHERRARWRYHYCADRFGTGG